MKKSAPLIPALLTLLHLSLAAPAFATTYTITASYSISGGGSPTAPTLNYYNETDTLTHKTLTSTPTVYTTFAGSAWSVTPNPLTGSSSSQRWETGTVTSGTVTATFTLAPSYFHQYNATLKFTSPQTPLYNRPTVSYAAFGATATAKLQPSYTTYWVDAGQSWTAQTPFTTTPNFLTVYPTPASNATTGAGTFTIAYQGETTAQCLASNPLVQILDCSPVAGLIGVWSAPWGLGFWLSIGLLGVNVAIWNKSQSIMMGMLILAITSGVFGWAFPAQFGTVAVALVVIASAAIFYKGILLGR